MNEERKRISSIEYNTKYLRSFKKLPIPIQQKTREKEYLFYANPFDPRLETHKLRGKFNGYWAYSVNHKYRVIFRFISNVKVLFFDIGLHPIYGQSE